MQSQPFHLIRQQMILKELGFYTGPLDGIWGPDAIEAMKKFENRLDLYRPARPSCGMPFADGARLPAGMWFSRDGYVCNDSATEQASPKEIEARVAYETAERKRLESRNKPKPGTATVVSPVADVTVTETVSAIQDPTEVEVKAKIIRDDPKPQQHQGKHQHNGQQNKR